MNKEFVIKMLKAKKLEYEAIKAILPEEIRNRIDVLEMEAKDLCKEIALEFMRGNSEDEEQKKAKMRKVEVS